ncbi:MAG: acyltransferase [Phycisphaerae bacterium]|nr:acyltransferase [Phycisphaerae bacterium]
MTDLSKPQRLYFIENLRVLLIVLVIAHHAGQAYGPGGWWYFQEADRARILGLFFVLNRSFFMSLFFMVSGYFLPASYDRKGPGRFLKDRFVRLGIPLVVFFFGIIPVMTYAYYVNFRPYGPMPFGEYYIKVFFGMGPKPADWSGPSWPDLQFGHLWFVEHLLILAICYAGWRMARGRSAQTGQVDAKLPTHRAIILLSLGVAVVTAVVRIWYPIDYWVAFLGFIQTMFADVPRDVTWFVLGVIAYRRNWLTRFPARMGWIWLGVGVGLGGVMCLMGIVGVWFFPGGFELWEGFFCSGMCIGLVVLFREKLGAGGFIATRLGPCTYAAYLFHVPVIVLIQYGLGHTSLHPLSKLALVTLIGVPLTFVLSYVLRRLPGGRRVL